MAPKTLKSVRFPSIMSIWIDCPLGSRSAESFFVSELNSSAKELAAWLTSSMPTSVRDFLCCFVLVSLRYVTITSLTTAGLDTHGFATEVL